MRLIASLCLLLAVLPAVAGLAHTPAAKSTRPGILLIYSNDRLLPTSQQFDAGLRSTLDSRLHENFDLYTEFLDIDRFPDATHEQGMATYLRNRYAQNPPQLVIAAGRQSLSFVRKHRGGALPDGPVVFGGVRASAYALPSGHVEYGVTMALAMWPTLELMIRLHPEVKEVLVVSGASLVDQELAETSRMEFAPLMSRVHLTWWSAPSVAELLARGRKLSPGTAIFFVSYAGDARGTVYTSNQVLEQLAEVAPVPIYGFSLTYVGRGVVGGQGEHYEKHGRAVGLLAADILQGHSPAHQGAISGPPPVFRFDAPRLAQWKIDRLKLPAGREIVNEEPDSWGELRPYFAFATAVIILLVALVVILLVNRQRLSRTERELSERLRFEQLASAISAALINTLPDKMDGEIVRSLEKIRVMMQLDRCLMFDFVYTTQVKRVTHRAESIEYPPIDRTMPVSRLPWFFRQLQEGRIVAIANTARDLPLEAAAERAYCLERQIHSVLIMPVRQSGQHIRWMGFYTARREQVWLPELVARLHVVSESLVSALAGAQAELALRSSEQLNRDILASLNEQVAVLDRAGTILSVNPAWYRYLGLGETRSSVVGSNYLEACRRSAAGPGQVEARAVLAALEGVLGGTRRHFELEYTGAVPGNPVPVWFRMTITPLDSAAGGAVVMHWDISEQRRMHEALRQSEARYREVVESQTDLVCRYLVDSTLTFVNEAYCRFFGRSRESLLGRPFLELIPESSRPIVMEQIAAMHRDRQSHTYEHVVHLPDGGLRWQQWVDHPILDEQGHVEEFQAIGRDITDRKRAEEANRNLAHSARLAIAGELTASITHEISQPLGAILSNADAAEILLERPDPPLDEVRAILADIRKDDLRARDIILHLRSLLRKHELDTQPLNLHEVITEVIRLAAADAQRRRIRFVREFTDLLPTVPGDRVNLQQVLLNLMLNAMDAMAETPPDRRRLTIRTQRTAEGGVEVFITDTGHGIPPDRINRIFESFFTTKKDGMGIGLSIVRSIIEAHRGTIFAINLPEGGATFSFRLPPAQRLEASPGVQG